MDDYKNSKMILRMPMRQFKNKYGIETEGCVSDFRGGLIETVHKIVCNSCNEFPERPSELFDAVAYWESACYFMTCILAWSNPAKGLLCWYENNISCRNDSYLKLLKDIWDYDGHFDLLAAWFWSKNGFLLWKTFITPMLRNADSGLFSPVHLSPDLRWWQEFNNRHRKPPKYPNPYFGGYNPLHLVHYGELWEDPDSNVTLIKSAGKNKRAILIMDTPKGWYTALHRYARELGQLGWLLDVVVEKIGWLGSFKRSPITGLWYQGSHSVHLAGNLHNRGDESNWTNADQLSACSVLPPEYILNFISNSNLRISNPNESINFLLPIGAKYLSIKNEPRTILAYAFNNANEPVYILRLDDKNKMDFKRSWKAHDEYLHVGYDTEILWSMKLK
jgi:hypothetical protein